MTKKITLTLPDNLYKYIQDKGISPSRFLQKKIKDEIRSERKEKQYNLKDEK